MILFGRERKQVEGLVVEGRYPDVEGRREEIHQDRPYARGELGRVACGIREAGERTGA